MHKKKKTQLISGGEKRLTAATRQMAAVRTTTTTCISPHRNNPTQRLLRENRWEGFFYLSLFSFSLFPSAYCVCMYICFNSCIVYTIPAHITYSTANSFLHTYTHWHEDMACGPTLARYIWHMFTYLDSSDRPTGRPTLIPTPSFHPNCMRRNS